MSKPIEVHWVYGKGDISAKINAADAEALVRIGVLRESRSYLVPKNSKNQALIRRYKKVD